MIILRVKFRERKANLLEFWTQLKTHVKPKDRVFRFSSLKKFKERFGLKTDKEDLNELRKIVWTREFRGADEVILKRKDTKDS